MAQQNSVVIQQKTPEFGMDIEFVEGASLFVEETHESIQDALGSTSGVAAGLVGILATGWLFYALVILAIPNISFNTKTFATIQRPPKKATPLAIGLAQVYTTIERAYWALHGLSPALRKKSTLRTSTYASPALQSLLKTLRLRQHALHRRITSQRNLDQIHTILQNYLQSRPPRTRNYAAFFFKNLFRKDALHMDHSIFFTRGLLLGLLFIFSCRLFFAGFKLTEA